MNVVYDAEGYEYPVDDHGMICFPEDEQNDVNNEDRTSRKTTEISWECDICKCHSLLN